MTSQPSLLDWQPPSPPAYGGATFDAERDGLRLNAQCKRVYDVMKDGAWHTLKQISAATGDPEASISARIRDLRKSAFGGFRIDREYIERGLWKYRMVRG